ncbi:hypothetical protein FRB99_003275 [Tulasnella sp. 403]|nr:hypothetical protein FRB99_003275 [Tulasnella sp. 403]
MSFLSRAVEGFFKVFDRRGESIDYTSSGLVDIHMGNIESPTDASGRVTIVYIRSLRLSAQSRSRDQVVTRLRRQVQEWKDLPANSRIVPYAGYAILDEIGCVISKGFMVDLATYLEDPKTTRRPIVRQVAEGMRFLHCLSPSIIHGDLCDINIVINDRGEAMIRNYGLWRLVDKDRLYSDFDRSLLDRYAAPEIMEGQIYNEKTDIWAFGCLALEILTKKSPKFTFHGKAQLRLMIYQGKRRALAVFPELGEEACSSLQKCWDPTPQNRPSMDTLFGEIRRWPAVGRNPTTQEPTFVPGEHMQEELTDALGSQSSLQLDRRPWTESPVPSSSDLLG